MPDREQELRREHQSGDVGSEAPVYGSDRRGSPNWIGIALLAIGIVLVAVGSAVYFGSRADEVYGARVEILYAASDATSDDSRERILATQRELLRSRVVLAEVSSSTAMPLDELQDALTVEVGRDDLLRLTVGDEDPERARLVAQAIAARYLELTGRLLPGIDRGKLLIQAQIERLRAGDRPLSPTARDRIARLRDRRLDLEVQRATQPKAEQLSPAYVLEKPLSPDPVRSAALGLMIGLLLATAVTVAMLRRRVTGWR